VELRINLEVNSGMALTYRRCCLAANGNCRDSSDWDARMFAEFVVCTDPPAHRHLSGAACRRTRFVCGQASTGIHRSRRRGRRQ